MQSVHAEEVVVQMMKMYGDFGKFTNNGGNVFYESNIGKKIQGELWAEINVYASGYHAAIDDLAALRAERDELREALEAFMPVVVDYRKENMDNTAMVKAYVKAAAVLAKYEVTK